jgi:hypothetical protein
LTGPTWGQRRSRSRNMSRSNSARMVNRVSPGMSPRPTYRLIALAQPEFLGAHRIHAPGPLMPHPPTTSSSSCSSTSASATDLRQGQRQRVSVVGRRLTALLHVGFALQYQQVAPVDVIPRSRQVGRHLFIALDDFTGVLYGVQSGSVTKPASLNQLRDRIAKGMGRSLSTDTWEKERDGFLNQVKPLVAQGEAEELLSKIEIDHLAVEHSNAAQIFYTNKLRITLLPILSIRSRHDLLSRHPPPGWRGAI